MFELAAGYAKRGMSAYSELQTAEFASEGAGYTATKHQREVRGRRGEEGQFFVFFFFSLRPHPPLSPLPPSPLQVGTGYFDAVSTVCSQGASSTLALKGSTEASQFD